MELSDITAFGISLPHRSQDPINMEEVRAVATKAEELGFEELWVTENTLDAVTSFDPIVALTYAAALTTHIRLGASVVVLPVHDPRLVAHQWATLDYVSNGRAILGAGIGRPFHYKAFGVEQKTRSARFREQIEVIRALWSKEDVTYFGDFYELENVRLGIRPVQQPLPIWVGTGHPDSIARLARYADGWMAAGGATNEEFGDLVPLLKESLERFGRDPKQFPISKRVFISVDDNAEVAKAELQRWFSEVYHNPIGADYSGIYGTPRQVQDKLYDLMGLGANHLLLNPVARYTEQIEVLADVIGLPIEEWSDDEP